MSLEALGPAEVAFHATSPLRWESIAVDLGDVAEWDGVHRAIRRAIDTSLDVPANETLLTIRLEGATRLATEIRHPETTDSLTDEILYDAGLRDLFLEVRGLRRPVERERFLVEPIRSMCELVRALRSGDENIDSIAPPKFAGAPLSRTGNANTCWRFSKARRTNSSIACGRSGHEIPRRPHRRLRFTHEA